MSRRVTITFRDDSSLPKVEFTGDLWSGRHVMRAIRAMQKSLGKYKRDQMAKIQARELVKKQTLEMAEAIRWGREDKHIKEGVNEDGSAAESATGAAAAES